MEAVELKYNTYPTYKDSGVEWVKKIPEHWELESFKNILVERNEKNDPIITTERLSLSIDKGVTLYAEKTTNLDRFKDDFTKYKLAYKGDLVFNSMNMIVGAVGISDYFGCISPVYYTYHASHNNSHTSKFYEYLFRCKTIQGVLYSLGKGLMAIDRGEGKYNTLRLKVSRDDLRSLKLPYPNFTEQTVIVNFLDNKTAKIDQAIAQKQKLIELLKERKQILIQNAVTKGLDPNVKMIDSGVEWIGEVPEKWEVKRLKYIANVVLGKMISNLNLGSMELKPYLKSKNIQWLRVDVSSVDEMWFTKQEMEQYRLKKDDLVLSEGGEVGKTCIWNNELPECYIQNSAHKVTVKDDCNPFFYLYLFNHIGKHGGFDSIINRVSIGHLTKDKLMNIEVVQPSFEEQTAIVAHIEAQSTKIDKAIILQQTQIEKLKEYKATLIDSAVTGKIKVS